jgi:hypothetical protein
MEVGEDVSGRRPCSDLARPSSPARSPDPRSDVCNGSENYFEKRLFKKLPKYSEEVKKTFWGLPTRNKQLLILKITDSGEGGFFKKRLGTRNSCLASLYI